MGKDKLKEIMADGDKSVIAVVGAGVSLAATRQAECASWKGLLDKGIEKVEGVLNASRYQKWSRIQREVLTSEDPHINELLALAGQIKRFLDDEDNQWADFLSETVGDLDVKNEELIRAIESLDIPIITTNYDDVIEQCLDNRDPTTWKRHKEARKAMNGERDFVVHMHGYWAEEDSVIFDFEGYEEIKQSDTFQTLLKGGAAFKAFLFIGVGDGLKDPHFKKFFEWTDEFRDVEDDHYILTHENNKKELKKEYSKSNVNIISYGDEYKHLPEFLEDIAPSDPGPSGGGFLISHPTRVMRLKSDAEQHKSFLLDDNLEFVEPEGKEYHPTRILERLRNSDSPDGVLLVGAGGVGKSRILMQTAKCAHERDSWQVFHAVTTAQLNNETLKGALTELPIDNQHTKNYNTVLIVIDEPSNSNLDFYDVNERIKHDFDFDIKFLVSSRPSNHSKYKERGWLDLFGVDENIIHMNSSDSHTEEVSRLIQQEVISDDVSDILGDDEVNEICGDRPVIAMFIAKELNRLAKNGELISKNLPDMRSQNLSYWLEQRLEENRLRTKMEGEFPEASDHLLVAAAVMGTGPAERRRLLQVAESLLSEIPIDNPYGKGEHIVEEHLEEPQWIEQQELEWRGSTQDAMGLGPAHDVVTDELLDEIFLIERGASPEERLRQFLSACTDDLVAWANITKSLGRLRDRIEEDSDRYTRLQETFSSKTDEWLRSNSGELANSSFRKSESIEWGDNFTYFNAISASLEAGLWSDDLLIQELALPWLRKEGREYELARFLFVKLLTIGHESDAVVEEALVWFDNHTHDPDAAYVLYLAAKQLDGNCERSKTAADLGVDWFESERRQSEGGLWNGQFILTELLQWDEKHRVDDLVDWAFRWLDEFADQRRARYVIQTLLKQVYSEEETPEKLKCCALNWLNEYGTEIQAHQVIGPLLENGDLEGEALKDAVSHTTRWISNEDRSLSTKARYVLQSALEILRKEDRGDDLFDEVDLIDKALTWLKNYWNTDNEHIKVELVIEALLWIPDHTNIETLEKTLKYSLLWLYKNNHKNEERAQHVYTRILRHPDVDDDVKSEIAESACEWLGQHHSSEERDYIINSLLLNWKSVPPSDQQDVDVIEAALDLGREVVSDEEEAAFSKEEAKKVLLNVQGAEPDTTQSEDAERLLNELGYDLQKETYRAEFKKRSMSISNALEQVTNDDKRAKLLKEGAELLCNQQTYQFQCKGWHKLLEDILNYVEFKDRERVIKAVRKEVCHLQASQDKRWSFAYQELLKNEDDPTEDDVLIETGFDWLESCNNFQHEAWRHMFKSMLEHFAVEPELRKRLISIGKRWMDGDGPEQHDHWGDVYELILNTKELDDDKKDILEKGYTFLEEYRHHGHWSRVFKISKQKIDTLDSEKQKYENMLNNAAISSNR